MDAAIYAPVGRCIYCGSAKEPLSDEHIIPFALNGTLILPRASCESCADVTKKFEQVVTRSNYGPLRIKQDFKTRRKKERPKDLPVAYLDGEGAVQQVPLTVPNYPTVYLAAEFPRAGLFTGAPLSDRNPEFKIHLKGNKDDIARAIQTIKQQNIQLSSLFSWGAFSRLLAKIAHAYVVASIGQSGYEPLLPELILGNSAHLSHVVGGIENATVPATDLALLLVEHQSDHYLVVHIRLLGGNRLPPYEVVVGKVTDVTTVLDGISRLTISA